VLGIKFEVCSSRRLQHLASTEKIKRTIIINTQKPKAAAKAKEEKGSNYNYQKIYS